MTDNKNDDTARPAPDNSNVVPLDRAARRRAGKEARKAQQPGLFFSGTRPSIRQPLQPKQPLPNNHPLLQHRLQTARNGYAQCPTANKRGCKGWPKIACDETAIMSMKEWRATFYSGTGIRMEGELCAIDADISIKSIADEVLAAIRDLDSDAFGKAILRTSGAVTFALFYRCRKPFGRRATQRYTAHPDRLQALLKAQKLPDSDDEEHALKQQAIKEATAALEPQFLEIHGPEATRLMQVDGPHSPGRDYHCSGRAPWNTRLDELPYLPAEDRGPDNTAAGKIVDMIEAILVRHLTRIIDTEPGGAGSVIYDLKPETEFVERDGSGYTCGELALMLMPGAENGKSGCMGWIAYAVSESKTNCKAFVTHGGRFAIKNWAEGVTHYFEADKPPPTELDADTIAALKALYEAATPGTATAGGQDGDDGAGNGDAGKDDEAEDDDGTQHAAADKDGGAGDDDDDAEDADKDDDDHAEDDGKNAGGGDGDGGDGNKGGKGAGRRPRVVRPDELVGHAPSGKFIHRPTRELWSAVTVDKVISKFDTGMRDGNKKIKMPASTLIMKVNRVEQLSWMPGMPEIIEDAVVMENGIVPTPGMRVYNQYRAPVVEDGDPEQAGRWFDHVDMVYPDTADADHIVAYLAHTVQFPGIKINHALLLGGAPGIGKDTLLVPVRYAIGPWNFQEIRPPDLFGQFNGYQKAVLLRINELHDLGGDATMYTLYERLKPMTAAPPEAARINEKNLGEYYIPNINKTVMTTNYKENGVYLPADDRRTFVAWSPLEAKPAQAYFDELNAWFEREGNRHVSAYLRQYDLATFNAKAPPRMTAAFWAIVNANRSVTETGVDDVIAAMTAGNGGVAPDIVTGGDLEKAAFATAGLYDVGERLRDRKYRRHVPAYLERCGYVAIKNPDAEDWRWRVDRRKQMVYGRRGLSGEDALRLIAARIAREGGGKREEKFTEEEDVIDLGARTRKR